MTRALAIEINRLRTTHTDEDTLTVLVLRYHISRKRAAAWLKAAIEKQERCAS